MYNAYPKMSMLDRVFIVCVVQIARQTFELLCELADLGYRQERLKPILCLDLEAAETLVSDG